MTTFVPGTARGVWLKSELPKRYAQADSLDCRREDQSRLIVMFHCLVIWSQLERRK